MPITLNISCIPQYNVIQYAAYECLFIDGLGVASSFYEMAGGKSGLQRVRVAYDTVVQWMRWALRLSTPLQHNITQVENAAHDRNWGVEGAQI